MRFEEQYLQLTSDTINFGARRPDRTGTGTRSTFGATLTADLSREFPILVTKPVAWRTAIIELLWMLSGSTSVRPLQEQGVHIWDAWANVDGELGPVYGAQWRRNGAPDWYSTTIKPLDQVRNVIALLHSDPFSRRHLVSAWNVGQLHHMHLPPCHYAFQFYVDHDDEKQLRLNCLVNMRSSDLPVGLPFNVIAYATLTLMICRELKYQPGLLRFVLADAHVYENQVELALEQIERPTAYQRLVDQAYDNALTAHNQEHSATLQAEGLAYPPHGRGPKLVIKPTFRSVLDATIDDFDVLDYWPIEPRINYPVAI